MNSFSSPTHPKIRAGVRPLFLAYLLFIMAARAFAQDATHAQGYDSLLAKRLGADEYGMKRYVIAFLKTGPVKMTDSTERARLQSGHLLNIQRLANEGKLIIAGPFLDGQNLRGIFVFNVETVEEAKQFAESDPAVKAGIFDLEFHPWYGSAALMETTNLHHRVEKSNIFK